MTQFVLIVPSSLGVTELLVKGNDTCTRLKSSINGALSILIGDATVAKNSMTASCDRLKTHLNDTNHHVADTLRKLQEELSTWLGEVI